ncbi:MAG: hypothetical protein LBB85_11640 [Dysgonamonadaceae bacterium]|jgi:ABC-type uncharacterized transport system substrate-binding protein|nr:hypothetical protein [Dysgonamonadaceae bacterium]
MRGILLDENGDLLIKPVRENGLISSGLVVGSNDYQGVRLVIEAQKGELKEAPTVGFGIDNYLKSPEEVKQKFVNELTKELKSVGFKEAKVMAGETLLEFEVEING